MSKLRPGALSDDKPVKLTLDLPAQVHRELATYGKMPERETSQTIKHPAKLFAPTVERFMASDQCFAKLRRLEPK